jgi:hypothetical protein
MPLRPLFPFPSSHPSSHPSSPTMQRLLACRGLFVHRPVALLSHRAVASHRVLSTGLRSVSRSTVPVDGLSPLQAYDRMASKDVIQADQAQRQIVAELDILYQQLKHYNPGPYPFTPPVPHFDSAVCPHRTQTHLAIH